MSVSWDFFTAAADSGVDFPSVQSELSSDVRQPSRTLRKMANNRDCQRRFEIAFFTRNACSIRAFLQASGWQHLIRERASTVGDGGGLVCACRCALYSRWSERDASAAAIRSCRLRMTPPYGKREMASDCQSSRRSHLGDAVA